MTQQLKFKKLTDTAILPTCGTEHSAGYDLYVNSHENITSDYWKDIGIYDLEHKIKFGVAVEIPEGYVGLLFERSSLYKKELGLVNSVGVIDSDYRGELMAVLEGSEETIKIGDRVCQLVVVPCFMADPVFVDELSETVRDQGGFGSTDDAAA